MAVHFGLKRRLLLRGLGSKRSSQPCRCFLSPDSEGERRSEEVDTDESRVGGGVKE